MAKVSAFNSFHSMGVPLGVAMPMPQKDTTPYYDDPGRTKREEQKKDEIIPEQIEKDCGFRTKCKIAALNAGNVLSEYPRRGFAGSKNTTFFESLTMGMFPYVTGGLTFIALFNGISKKFMSQSKAKAAGKFGLGMALGVIFYGVAKELSKKLISVPVALKTGIDMDRPYRKIINRIPESSQENGSNSSAQVGEMKDEKGIEYHKIYESVDFPRFDLLYKNKPGENRNEYFDYIAKKNGFGTNLNDSDQEVKPFIKDVVVKTKTAQNLAQYLWAAVGVGIGVQKPWENLIENRLSYKTSGLPFFTTLKRNLILLKDSAKNSCKEFFNGGKIGEVNPHARIAGRVLLGLAALTTVAGIINAVKNPYMNNNKSMNIASPFKNDGKVQED